MYARKLFTGLAASAVAVSALTLSATSAFAAVTVDPDDTTFAPTATDLVGVGSDTSQHALKLIAEGYNATNPTVKLATYAATGGGEIPIAAVGGSGNATRPNGSGPGKATLYGSTNNTAVDFARSSSEQSPAETAASLQSFPFALDTLVMAVSGSSSHAPANLTPADIVAIYHGDKTNWNQFPGGTAGVIKPYTPQPGSGTGKFFIAQLKAANGGTAVDFAGTVTETQEHDDTLIKNNPDAVVPFSEGRANLLGTLRLETGFRADRALYNVVRGADVGLPAIQSVFGSGGYVCSNDARQSIEDAGFKQLATPAKGGVCGSPTQGTASNFTLNTEASVETTTTLTVTSTTAKSAKLTAKVTSSTAPQGTVSFFQGETPIAANVPLTSGQAVKTLSGLTPGSKTYTAVFNPADGSVFAASSDNGTGVVKTSSSIKETFPASVKQGKRASGVVTVTLTGISAKATGSIKITKGAKVLVTRTLSGGKVTIKLPALTNGINKLKITYVGNGNAVGSTKTFTVKQIKKKK